MIKNLLQNLSQKTNAKIRIIEDLSDFDTTKIKKGMLSIHANWSGQSIAYGQSILQAIDESKCDDFEIFLIDNDSVAREKIRDLIGIFSHGYFESVWIENGNITYTYSDNNKATELKKFIEFLKEKLNN